MDNSNQQPQVESPCQPQGNTQWQHQDNTQWQHQDNTQFQAQSNTQWQHQANNHSQLQANTHSQPQVDSQDPPPSYSESIKNSTQTGYENYPQSYLQNPAPYPTQQGYAATAGYDPSKAAYPTQCYQPGGGYTNYGHQPYYPPPEASNNNQTVIAQNQYRMGNVEMGHVRNLEARKFIRISVFVGFKLIIISILIRVLLYKHYYTSNKYD